MKRIFNGIFKENPVLVLVLGLCSALAVTKTVEGAYVMGICLTSVLLFSNTIISIIKKLVPNNIKIPVYILIIGTFVTILEIIIGTYFPLLNQSFGIYLPLIVVNCIILGRALSVASTESVGVSILDAIGIGIGYTLSITLIALIRGLLGSNSIVIIDSLSSLTNNTKIIFTDILPDQLILPIFNSPAGAFLVLGLLIAAFNAIKNRGKKHESN